MTADLRQEVEIALFLHMHNDKMVKMISKVSQSIKYPNISHTHNENMKKFTQNVVTSTNFQPPPLLNYIER